MDYDALLKLAALIAHYMPDGWRVDCRPIDKDTQHQGARIIGNNHTALRLYQGYQSKGKITICGECPDYGLTWQQRRNACLPHGSASINVSPSRNPRHIAADIERRLLSDCVAMLEKAEQAAQDYKTNIAQLEQVEHVLRCVMPDLKNNQNNEYNTQRSYYMYERDGGVFRSGELSASGYGGLSCNMKLHDVSIDTSIKILALLRQGETV